MVFLLCYYFVLIIAYMLICILVFCIIQKYTIIPCVQTDNEDTLLSSFYNYVYSSIDGVETCILGYICVILEVCNEYLDVFILRKCYKTFGTSKSFCKNYIF